MMSALRGGDWLWRRCNSSSVAMLHKGLPFQCFTTVLTVPVFLLILFKRTHEGSTKIQLCWTTLRRICQSYKTITILDRSGCMCTPDKRSPPYGSSRQLEIAYIQCTYCVDLCFSLGRQTFGHFSAMLVISRIAYTYTV
jgi:hypothetical protein